jgi:hypothetical protein
MCTDVRTLIDSDEAEDSIHWKPDTIQGLEGLIKRSFINYRARAQTQIGKGYARPMVICTPGGGGR